MKRLLMGLVLLVTAGSASAEWTSVGENDEFILYVDGVTNRRNDNLVMMWTLFDYKSVQKEASGKSYLSQRIQQEYDCDEKKERTLALILLDGPMGNGKAVYSDSDLGKWFPVSPGSIVEVLSKIACGEK